MKKRNVSDWASPRATGAEGAGAHTSDEPRPKTGKPGSGRPKWRLRALVAGCAVAVITVVLGACSAWTDLIGTGRHAPVQLGIVGASGHDFAVEQAAGVQMVMIGVSWSSAEPVRQHLPLVGAGQDRQRPIQITWRRTRRGFAVSAGLGVLSSGRHSFRGPVRRRLHRSGGLRQRHRQRGYQPGGASRGSGLSPSPVRTHPRRPPRRGANRGRTTGPAQLSRGSTRGTRTLSGPTTRARRRRRPRRRTRSATHR